MKKSTLIMILSLVLAVAIGIGSTMAYLQDTDEDVNVMTLGNVYIDQIELERGEDGILQEFTQGQPLYPAVYDDKSAWQPVWPEDDPNTIHWAAADENGLIDGIPEGAWNGMWDAEKISNVVDKFVFVKNTGKSDAYIRTIYAFEQDTTDFKAQNNNEELIHINWNGNNRFDYSQEDDVQLSPRDIVYIDDVVIDNVTYSLVVVTYTEPVAPGEVIRPSLLQVGMSNLAGNEEVEQFGETYDILVVSQAVQTQGFADAASALEAAFGVVDADNNPWKKDGVDLDGTPAFPVFVSNAGEAMDALLNGDGGDIIADKDLDGELIYESNAAIELDAKGATVVLDGSAETKKWSYFGFVPPAGEDVAVSNLNVTGAGFVEVGHYAQGGGDYTLDNVEIKNFSATMAVKDGANTVAPAFCHYGTATLNDCTMTGSTTEAEGATAYDAGFVNGTTTYINGGEYGKIYVWSQAHVTIKDAEVDVINSAAITTKNLGMLTIDAGAHVGTINLIPAGTYTPALTIEEGATVDAIVYQGVTYTQAEWLAR